PQPTASGGEFNPKLEPKFEQDPEPEPEPDCYPEEILNPEPKPKRELTAFEIFGKGGFGGTGFGGGSGDDTKMGKISILIPKELAVPPAEQNIWLKYFGFGGIYKGYTLKYKDKAYRVPFSELPVDLIEAPAPLPDYAYAELDSNNKLVRILESHRYDKFLTKTKWEVIAKECNAVPTHGIITFEQFIDNINIGLEKRKKYLQNLGSDLREKVDIDEVEDDPNINNFESYVPEPISDEELMQDKTPDVKVQSAEDMVIDANFEDDILKRYYDKQIEKEDEPFVVIFGGKKREWAPIDGKRKAKNMTPLTLLDKLELTLEGAKGSDLGYVKDSLSQVMGVDKSKVSAGYCVAWYNKASTEDKKKFKDTIKVIEDKKIFWGRPVGYGMSEIGQHGIDHAKRLVKYIGRIAAYIREYHTEFGLPSPTNEEILLAKYGALFHDTGRANEWIDVFDEVSSEIAAKELKGKLSGRQILRVKNAIMNKDANVKGKDIVAIMVHEADCLDIQRVKSNFDPRYLDLHACFFNANPNGDIGKASDGKLWNKMWDLISWTKGEIDSSEY
ncbi:MAG: hypothetical protein Q4D57_06345, partial [Clostridia bacterium]|nr:hypothetical protein [Clostridia bacterium]